MDNNNAPKYATAFTITVNPVVAAKMGSKKLIKQSFKKLKWLLSTHIKKCMCTMELTKKGIPHFHGWYEDEDIDEAGFHLLIHSMTYKSDATFYGFILLKPADDMEGWERYMFKEQETVRQLFRKLKIDCETVIKHTRKTVIDMIELHKIDLDETELEIKQLVFD
jgi:hypothetical protein